MLSCAVGLVGVYAEVIAGAAATPSLPAAPQVQRPSRTLSGEPIRLWVDAIDAPRGVFHVKERFPLRSGWKSFYYPEYIPGEHRPSGPLNDLLDMQFTVNGERVAWHRDSVDLYRFHVDIPAGARELTVEFTYATAPYTVTALNLARVKWNRLLLYPATRTTDDVPIAATITMPKDWKIATSLDPTYRPLRSSNSQEFAPVSVTELIDSPAQIGEYFAEYPLGLLSRAPVKLAVMADEPGYEKISEASVQKTRDLVREAEALFGGRHFRDYTFLVTLSNRGAGAGLEHHESSEDGTGLNNGNAMGGLLAHEFTHSWNGKYRRPAGLATPEFHTPMQGDLLWVYEGLTQYLGYVLAARSGWDTPEGFRNTLTRSAKSYDTSPGRDWRSIGDTARATGILRQPPTYYRRERRGQDYYGEGAFVWLEADLMIRTGTNGKRSLDDFVRAFFGGVTDMPEVKPYRLKDVVDGLNHVMKYDWSRFLKQRIEGLETTTMAAILAKGGYEVQAVASEPSASRGGGGGGATASIASSEFGMTLDSAGTVTDLALDGPAFAGEVGLSDKIVSIDDEAFSAEGLRAASASREKPVKLGVNRQGKILSLLVSPMGTTTYRLVPKPGATLLLDEISKPRAR